MIAVIDWHAVGTHLVASLGGFLAGWGARDMFRELRLRCRGKRHD